MAQMPRGEPRSVPDPIGEQYDEMIRQERLKRQAAQDTAFDSTATAGSADYFSPFRKRVDDLDLRPRPDLVAPADGRDIDPRCIVQSDGSTGSPGELAEQQRAIQKALFMADHPLGAAAYGLAALTGASPQVRDGALVAGGFADAAMMGAAPTGAPIRGRAAAPQARSEAPALNAPVRLRELNSNAQPMGVNAAITRSALGTGTRVPTWLKPPGWQDDAGLARGHILGKQLGGLGEDRRNAVTLTQKPTNSPRMRDFENMVARRVRAGEVVEYSATPLYSDGILPPGGMLLTAHGSRGDPRALFIQNPAGQRR